MAVQLVPGGGPSVFYYGFAAAPFALGAEVRSEPLRKVFLEVGYEPGWLEIDDVEWLDVFRLEVGSIC